METTVNHSSYSACFSACFAPNPNVAMLSCLSYLSTLVSAVLSVISWPKIGKRSTELSGEAFKNQHASLAAGAGGRGDLRPSAQV